MAREWDTPIRGPWNALIKQALDAIDRHEHLYRSTGNGWHAAKAHELRRYVCELKTWIHQQERATIFPDLTTTPPTICPWRYSRHDAP
jgi:hypothetical protein